MRYKNQIAFLFILLLSTGCVSKKKFTSLQMELDNANSEISATKKALSDCNTSLTERDQMIASLKNAQSQLEGQVQMKDNSITDLNGQIEDLKKQRQQQYEQIEGLTILSRAANENIGKTISTIQGKDEYIQFLQAAKSKTDSLNLALAINLKSVLQNNIADEDVEISVDKTVVYINLSDKMLYKSGSAAISAKANEVLEKIATIIKSRPDLDVMVEGYTDNKSIKTDCIEDNWDLSVKRATSVVRKLQKDHGVNPNKLIAAGRGEFNAIATNDNSEGMALNRRTRIILLPKMGEFYDLLDASKQPKM